MRPTKYKKYVKINEDDVLNLHINNFSIDDICSKLNATRYVVEKILNSRGIKLGTKVDRLKDKYEDIIKLYQKTNRLTTVAKEFNTTSHIINKILNLHNIPKREVIKELNIDEVIDFYKKTHKVKMVADKFGVSNFVILKLLHSNNIRVSKIKYSDDEIIKRYQEVKIIDRVSRDLQISDKTVARILNKHNIQTLAQKRKEVGDVFGKLTIIEETEPKITPSGKKIRQFILKCECGNEIKINSSKLSKRKTLNCGCINKEKKKLKEEKERIRKEKYKKLLLEREEKKKNKPKKTLRFKRDYFVGLVKDRLTILSIGTESLGKRTILCKCECGNIKEMSMHNFYQVKSCGCLQNENRVKASIKHGNAKRVDPNRRKWYDRWRSMIKRCYNPKIKSYPNYGGRGITVCDRWREPDGVGCENYYNDIHNILGPQPSPEHSLDRINNDGIYEITNLRWATKSQQTKNQRRHVKHKN